MVHWGVGGKIDAEILSRIRRAVRDKRYRMTDHALEEADNDDLSLSNILTVLMTGELDSVYTDNPRRARYVIRGDVGDNEVDVVCRFRHDGTVLIIITCMWLIEGEAMNTPPFPCEFCDTEQALVQKQVTVTRQRGGQWYIFEDVPAWACPYAE